MDEEDDGFMESGKKSGRKKPAYVGGLVLEPKKGVQILRCQLYFAVFVFCFYQVQSRSMRKLHLESFIKNVNYIFLCRAFNVVYKKSIINVELKLKNYLARAIITVSIKKSWLID